MSLLSISNILRDNELLEEALTFEQEMFSMFGKDKLESFAGRFERFRRGKIPWEGISSVHGTHHPLDNSNVLLVSTCVRWGTIIEVNHSFESLRWPISRIDDIWEMFWRKLAE